MSRVSIKDIARHAGVSHSTVSRALSDSPLVSAPTKTRIRRLAADLGYSPDAQARSLVSGRTLTIGVVVTTIADPFIAEVVQGIEVTAQDRGYSVILTGSNSEPQRELEAVDMLRSKRVDGVIVTSSRVGAVYLEHLERIGSPLVLINNHREDTGPYTFSVTVDNRHGGWLATRHLIDGGHRRLAYVSGPAGHSSDAGRFEGYCLALSESGIALDPALAQSGNGRSDGGEAALPALLGLPDRPSAVFCYNDMTAIGLILAARSRGLRIPEDLAVVGFDDIPFASFSCPPLTTIAQPKYEMGKRAAEMVLDLLEPSPSREQMCNVVFKGRLVVRESTGRGRWSC